MIEVKKAPMLLENLIQDILFFSGYNRMRYYIVC